MNQFIKPIWIERLRSKKYSQTKEALRDNIGFSVLGILCDIAVLHGVIPPPFEKFSSAYGKIFIYDGEEYGLSNNLMMWSGIHYCHGGFVDVTGHNDLKTLAQMNYDGWSFEEMAKFIEQQV
jgi:hypothetical protein